MRVVRARDGSHNVSTTGAIDIVRVYAFFPRHIYPPSPLSLTPMSVHLQARVPMTVPLSMLAFFSAVATRAVGPLILFDRPVRCA